VIEFFDGTCGYVSATKLCYVGIVLLTRVQVLWACSSASLLRLEVAKVQYLFMNFNLEKNIRSVSQTISAVITGHTF
jgi:hypothetical protein